MTTEPDQIIRANLDPALIPPKPIQTTVLGVVVGTQSAAAAICAVRYLTSLVSPGDPLFGEDPIFETGYSVLGAEMLPTGLSIPKLAAQVNRLARRLYDRDKRGDYHVLCDATDVGRPVIDAIRNSIIPQVAVTGVTITPNDRADPSLLWRNEATVGIRYLVSRLQAILQGRRLQVPNDPVVTGLLETLRDYDAEDANAPPLLRSLALACASEYLPVRYDLSPDELPSAAY